MKTSFRTKYGSPDILEIIESPIPKPKENEILVKIKASTINRTDEGVLLGKPFIFRFFVGFPKPRYAATGTDFSGIIIEKGAAADFEIGDEVYGFFDHGLGTHAEYACVSIDKPILKKPNNISHEQAAAALEGAHYAYFFLNKVSLKPTDSVLVNGATGAIGNAAIQFLIEKGVKVTSTYPSDSFDKIKHLKADQMIDYLKEDFTQLSDTFDFIFDAVGKSSFGACKHLLKPHGVYISSELGPKGENIPLSLLGLFKKGKRVVFPIPGNPKESMDFIKPLLENGKYVPLIDRFYSLENIREAYNYMLSGQKRGNVILKID